MKKQQIVILLLLLMMTPCLRAQKKEISQARSYIKSGKDFDKAEQLMTDLLARDSVYRQDKKVYLTWYQAVKKQYEAANEKLYLKQAYDTAAFFNLNRRMFGIVETLDTLDAQPDKKGRIRPEYRQTHAEELHVLRPNLYYGGTYLLRKELFADAYRFFDAYIDCARQPLFSSYDYLHTDTLMSLAAYWATYSGYRMNDASRVLRYSQLALGDTAKQQFTLHYMAEAYRWQQDESAYLQTMLQGFSRFPEYPYFFPHIVDYYASHGHMDSTLVMADRALQANPDNELFLYAKSTALLNLERYDECIAVSESLIAKNDTLPGPYFNIATAYLNQALMLEEENEPRLYRTKLQDLYRHARPYMEAYRKLAPDEKTKWAPALYRIYFNLNMGKQFEEIDRLMK